MKRPELVLFPPIAASLAAVMAMIYGANFWVVALIFFLTGPIVIALRLLVCLVPDGGSEDRFDSEADTRDLARRKRN